MDSARRCALHTAGAVASRETLLRASESWNERMGDGEAADGEVEAARWVHRSPSRRTAGVHAREHPAPDRAVLGLTEPRFQGRRPRGSDARQARLVAPRNPGAEPRSVPMPRGENRVGMPPGRERLLNGTRDTRGRGGHQAYNERQ